MKIFSPNSLKLQFENAQQYVIKTLVFPNQHKEFTQRHINQSQFGK